MKITKDQLDEASQQNIIDVSQVEPLYEFLKSKEAEMPVFNFTNVLYYLGGLIAIGAMTLFMSLGWESFGGLGIMMVCLIYAVAGIAISNNFARKSLTIPAGICATFVVCLTPLAVYGLQQWLGMWPDETVYKDYHRYIKWHWIYMELATLAVGAVIAWKYKYPFLVMPIAVTLWYMTMDVTAMLTGGDASWEIRKLVSMYSGLLMIAFAFWVDIRTAKKADYPFWLYLFGVLAFWCGLSSMHSDSEWSKFFYFCINLLMIGVGVLIVRRVFVIFGAIGSCAYFGHLAEHVFKESWLFPITLTAIGLGIIYLGVLWQKHERTITQKSRSFLPDKLRQFLESKT